MSRFRIKLNDGRIIGPLSEKDIHDLWNLKKISGDESAQIHPIGEWKKLIQHGFNFKPDQEGTFVINLDQIKFEKENTKPVKYESLPIEETVLLIEEEPKIEEVKEESDPSLNLLIDPEDLPKEMPLPDNKTTANIQKTQKDQNKTIIKPESLEYFKKEKLRQEELKKNNEKSRLESVEVVKKIDLKNDSTQVLSSLDLMKLNGDEILDAEKELFDQEAEVKFLAIQKKKEKKAEILKSVKNTIDPVKKSNRLPLIIGILVLVVVWLNPADEKPKTKEGISIIYPEILYPLPSEIAEETRAKILLEEANKLSKEFTFDKQVLAAKKFRESFEFDQENKEALFKLMKKYGELIKNSENFEKDANVLFSLIQNNKMSVTLNADAALGAASFFKAVGKSAAALKILDRYVVSKASAPSKELFALYLELLVDNNKGDKANEVSEALLKQEPLSPTIYSSLIYFKRVSGDREGAKNLIQKALKLYPESVELLILKGDILVEENLFKDLEVILKQIYSKNAEGSKIYYSKYLEFKGYIELSKQKPAEATKSFEESIKYHDSETLISSIINLGQVDSLAKDSASLFVRKVQAKKYTVDALENFNKNLYENALMLALKATAQKSGYLPAEAVLAKIQMKLGLANEALFNLKKFYENETGNLEVTFTYIELLIENFKLNEAKRIIMLLASTATRETWRYASANASLYERMGDTLQAISWLQKAINLNPLNDQNIHKLSQALFRVKNFSQSKNYLGKAMELDPNNIEYKISYAAILYELEGAEQAIGYLYNLLNDFPKNTRLMGEIAIYYNRQGKIQPFNDMKKQMEELPERDPSVYRFLIKAELIDEKVDNALKIAEELIRVEPGDLETMMQMGQVLMDQERYKDAAVWFRRIKDRLPSYPKIGYYKAKIEMFLENYEQSFADLDADIKENGDYEEAFVLKGDISAKQEKYIDAENFYKQAQKMNPKSFGAIMGLANVNFKRGLFDSALDLYSRAVKQEPGKPDIHRQLGETYRFLGQGALAIESYKMYLELYPTAPDKDQIEQNIRILE